MSENTWYAEVLAPTQRIRSPRSLKKTVLPKNNFFKPMD